MKTIALFLTVFFATSSLPSQAQFLDNGDFESWTQLDTNWMGGYYYTPAGWNDQQSYWFNSQPATDSHSGSFAAVLEPVMSCGIMPGTLLYGTGNPYSVDFWSNDPQFAGCGAPINFKPTLLKGYYKMPSMGIPDSGLVKVILKKFNPATQLTEKVGEGKLQLTPVEEYTYFEVPITDIQPGVMPDSIMIAFVSGTAFTWDSIAHYSRIYIDGLGLNRNEAMGINEQQATIHFSIYPNPSGGLVNFTFHADVEDDFQLVVHDLSGRQVMCQRVFSDQQMTLNFTGLSSGKYIATLLGKHQPYGHETIVVDGCVY